jgi:hypothetical protein
VVGQEIGERVDQPVIDDKEVDNVKWRQAGELDVDFCRDAGAVDQQRADERRCRRGTLDGLSVEVGDGKTPADHGAEPDQRCIGREERRDLIISGSNSSEVLRDDRGGFVNQNFAPGYATATAT